MPIARNGACRRTIRWWRPTMRSSARRSRRRSASGVAAAAPAGGGPPRNSRLRRPRRLDEVVALEPVDRDRDQPAYGEDADDEIAQRAEAVVERADRAPEPAVQLELARDQPQRL